ncbi:hypothetical protein BOX15_Mlig018346g3 [Macrostomum lignano]|uniref:Protein kinase domain-containing protein n=2 Tax=Macrostomum lignano TaxID=282301 RepID=A0A267GG61_9PLAT|nr:hypothetical protein BOX15_Mlig018346g3 [Macrostomum lignano]
MNAILKEFKVLGKKGEGTFSEVLKCQRNKDQKYYACKKMKHSYSSWEQVNALREIQAMRRLSPHPFIVQLEEIVYDKRSGSLVLVLELMDMNLYEFIRGRRHHLPEAKVQAFMWQMMRGIDHMHKLGIFHRDVKPENLLIRDDRLKLADFGSCRSVKSHPPFTEYISTRWYRAPECLLTDGFYGAAMDIWSAGCVIYEVTSLRPLFPGSNEVDQIAKIHDILGTPMSDVLLKFKGKSRHISYNFAVKRGTGLDSLLSNASPQCAEVVKKMLEYDPDSRPSARSLLKLPYFRDFRPKGELAAAIQQFQQEQKQKRATAGSGAAVATAPVASSGQAEAAAAAVSTASTSVGPSPAAAGQKVTMATSSLAPAPDAGRGKLTPVLDAPAMAAGPAAVGAAGSVLGNKFNAKELQQQRLRRRRMGQLYGQNQQSRLAGGGGAALSFPSLVQPHRHGALAASSNHPMAAGAAVRHAALLGGSNVVADAGTALGFANQSLSKQQQFYGSKQQQSTHKMFLPKGQLPSIKNNRNNKFS